MLQVADCFLGKNTILSGEDNFSLTKYDKDTGSTIYKYIFTAEKFEYDIKSGRVKEMSFRVKLNPDF